MSSPGSANALSVIGYFLTLVGLLGSFFYIHLSDWYRDVIALVTKWEINKYGDDPDLKAGRRECRYEIQKVSSWSILLSSYVVTAFIALLFGLSVIMWLAEPQRSDAWIYIGIAGIAFVSIYLGMTIGLLISGYKKALRLRKEIESKIVVAKKP